MATFEEATKRIDERTDDLIDLVREAVAIDTSVPPGRNYPEVIDLLEPRYKALGFETQRVTVPEQLLKIIPWPLQGPRQNLVATKRWPGNTEWCTTYAHMDVVPIEEAWKHDPFACEIVNGLMYGRGVADMKGSMVALILALEVMQELGLKSHYDMVSTLCTDEEVGIYPGIRYLAEEGFVKGHILTLESAGQDPLDPRGASGAIDFIITVHGKSAHSGLNYKGVNAIEQAVIILVELMKLKEAVEKQQSKFPSADPQAPFKVVNPKFNIDMINAGVKSNIVPLVCTLVVNRRTIPEENEEDVIAQVQDAVERGRKRSKALSVDVQHTINYPPVVYGHDNKYMDKRRAAIRAVKGYTELTPSFSGGSNDMSFIQRHLKTDLFVPFGPSRMTSNAHGADENVQVQDLVDTVKQLVHYLAF